MMRLLIFIFSSLLYVPLNAQQHPITFFTKSEATVVKNNLYKYPILTHSYNDIKQNVDQWIGKDVDVPFPKDPAGGYTHDKHKLNYTLMFNSGVLFNLTGDIKYATLVKQLLLKYAVLNPTLKNHPQATTSTPGRIFWQALNDANWMVYAGMAYDLVYNTLNIDEKKKIEEGAFKPEVDYFTKDLKDWFNRLHNHSVWACAGVGMIGIASHNNDYVNMALYGTQKDGKSGFIAQMDNLFSPDGYYTEGPYYLRYAILPFVLFANAINNTNPALKIFEHRDKILQKALTTCLQQTNSDGVFFPINDAVKDKDYTTNEIVTAVNTVWKIYGKDNGLLTIAKKQGRVIIDAGGVAMAAAITANNNIEAFYPYKTLESTDGVKGDEGGISILRSGKDKNLTSLIFKYASQGMGHGHFDRLNINLFDKGNEILKDYGSSRFIGIEQKFGGRYLPENKAFADQTITHNTIVVDETSHFNSDANLGQKFPSQKLFSAVSNPAMLVASAREENAYKHTKLQRTVYMLSLSEGRKIMVDIFNTKAEDEHQYDLPFQYNGQFIQASFKYTPELKKQETLGTKNGYQFMWKEAEASVFDTTIHFTFLNGSTYYTVSTLVKDSARVFFTRSGANDPNFNLRHEPAYIIRKKGKDQSFVNVIEIHGYYDPINEFSTDAYPHVQQIKLLQNNNEYTVVQISIAGNTLLIAQCNKDFEKTGKHTITINSLKTEWTGPCSVLYNNKKLN